MTSWHATQSRGKAASCTLPRPFPLRKKKKNRHFARRLMLPHFVSGSESFWSLLKNEGVTRKIPRADRTFWRERKGENLHCNLESPSVVFFFTVACSVDRTFNGGSKLIPFDLTKFGRELLRVLAARRFAGASVLLKNLLLPFSLFFDDDRG